MCCSKYSDNTLVWKKCFYILLIFLIMIPLYFIEVYIFYGIVIISHPGYNTTTGCPNDNPKCSVYFEGLLCYKNHMEFCYIMGWVIWMLSLPFIYLISIFCPQCNSKNISDALIYTENDTLTTE